MRIAIMGFPRSGKTTLFNVLARAHAPTGGFASGSGGVNVGTVSVPDARLEKLRDLFSPKKYTPARVEYVDFTGAMPKASETSEALYPAQLRAAELIVCCIRGFRDQSVSHPFDTVDPIRDIRRFNEELLLRDLQVVENRLMRLEKSARVGAAKEDALEAEVLKRCRGALESEKPLREIAFTADEEKRLRGFQLLTAKPLLTVLNIDESDLPGGGTSFATLSKEPPSPHTALVPVAARTEMELSSLEGEERREFMALLGIEESSLDRLIRMSYDLLGLCSFFTVGPDEVRAWNIVNGTRAVDAAGEIHSDLARGFIRAEVVRWDELLEAGSYNVLREKGKLRLEGKDYRVLDGDILNIRFSV
jgi:GTP-binding protein YchF